MQPRRNQSRNIIWFNPPFGSNVETNLARKFLKLVRKHFSKHRYHKICNKNNIKISYSCMDNMEKKVKKHNHNLLDRTIQTNETVIVAQIMLVPQMVNVYHQTLFIQLKFLLATITTETNILASARQNSKPDQVTIRIHLKTDKKKKTLNFLNIYGT